MQIKNKERIKTCTIEINNLDNITNFYLNNLIQSKHESEFKIQNIMDNQSNYQIFDICRARLQFFFSSSTNIDSMFRNNKTMINLYFFWK